LRSSRGFVVWRRPLDDRTSPGSHGMASKTDKLNDKESIYEDLEMVFLASLGGVLIFFALVGLPAAASAGLQTDGDVWIVAGERSGANLGQEVVAAGDVNGDGYRDLLVSGKAFNGSLYDARAIAFYGSANGLSETPDWSVTNDQPGSQFGRVLAAAGDVNGDGYDDVLVGAPYYDVGDGDEGRAYLYYGSAGGLSTVPGWTAEGNQYIARFGVSVDGAGDASGDGYDDVLVGADGFDNGHMTEGRGFLFPGGPDGVGASPILTAEGDQEGASFASAVAGPGDVDGDGVVELAFGAPEYDWQEADDGIVMVLEADASSPLPTPEPATPTHTHTYDAAANTDADGDSDGNTITVAR